MSSENPWKSLVTKVISGGQTGADRAALDAAIELGIEYGGYCPAGRKAEDGVIPHKYKLIEKGSYPERTRLNIRESDGTLVFNIGCLQGGTALTVNHARMIHHPCRIVSLDTYDPVRWLDRSHVMEWVQDYKIEILNVAGPRENRKPGVYLLVFRFMLGFLKQVEANRSLGSILDQG